MLRNPNKIKPIFLKPFIFTEDWIRPILKNDKQMLVHWWYYPDRWMFILFYIVFIDFLNVNYKLSDFYAVKRIGFTSDKPHCEDFDWMSNSSFNHRLAEFLFDSIWFLLAHFNRMCYSSTPSCGIKKVFICVITCFSYDSWIPASECDQEPEDPPQRTKPWEVRI